MDIRFPDKRCLTPRLLETDGRSARRLTGVIELVACAPNAPNAPTWRFVDAVDYDGLDCRYRVSCERGGARADDRDSTDSRTRDPARGPAERATDGKADAGPRWVDERDTLAYRSFSRLVVDRLRTFDRECAPCLHRFPGAPPSRALRRRLQRLDGPYALTVLDTCVTPDGRLWLQASLRDEAVPDRSGGDGANERHVDGWLVLAEASTVIGEAADVRLVPERVAA